MAKKVMVITGKPGSGMSTLGNAVLQALGSDFDAIVDIDHIVGDLISPGSRLDDPLEREAQKCLMQDGFVPDDMMASLVIKRIRKADPQVGLVLIGLPERTQQAHRLKRFIKNKLRAAPIVVHCNVSDDVSARRAREPKGGSARVAAWKQRAYPNRLRTFRAQGYKVMNHLAHGREITVDSSGSPEQSINMLMQRLPASAPAQSGQEVLST